MENIIVRVPNWLGDAVMALPVLAALRKKFPAGRITVAARAHIAEVFNYSPDVDEVVLVPRKAAALAQHAWSLRQRKFTHGILLTNSFATAAWLWLTGTRERIGYARDGRSFLLTERVMATPAILAAHQAEYYFALLEYFGIKISEMDLPRLALSASAEQEAEKFLETAGRGKYAVIAPCSAFGAVKDWAAERYGEVAQRLTGECGLKVFFTGTPAQRELIAKILVKNGSEAADDNPENRPAENSFSSRIVNAAGAVSLGGLFALIRRAEVFIGGDSGAAHAAAALGTPACVIFGITEPHRTRPLGDKTKIRILGEGGMETPDLRSPAVAAMARRALNAISVDQVTTAAQEILGA